MRSTNVIGAIMRSTNSPTFCLQVLYVLAIGNMAQFSGFNIGSASRKKFSILPDIIPELVPEYLLGHSSLGSVLLS
jgi:hypothetical protein